jgi:cyclase
MMKKIVVCLDVKDGRVVKGVKGEGFKDAGDPCEAAAYYCGEGADELVFLDITASVENREMMLDVMKKTAEKVSVPFTVGGGIRSVEDARRVVGAGAGRVSVGSAAVKHPELIAEIAKEFPVVAAVDVKDGYVCINGGHTVTERPAVEWAKECERLGACEILLTSFDADGTKAGYDIPLTRAVSDAVDIPVTASGGAGSLEDIYQGLTAGGAEKALVASLVHFRELSVRQIKEYLRGKGLEVVL